MNANPRIESPRIGLALGSGASRGWSHVGVLKALGEADIRPQIVCGTSVGALLGASFATGKLEAIEQWVRGAGRKDVLGFFSIKMNQGALVSVNRLNVFLHQFVAAEDCSFDELATTFVAVCTNLETGREVWLRKGSVAAAVRASMAMPGLFPPARLGSRWLVDGGLVNPVPVAACRALGADIVIGVNLNTDILGRHLARRKPPTDEDGDGLLGGLRKQARGFSSSLFADSDDREKPPGMFASISQSISIFQDRITRSRLAGDPADIMISPRVSDIGLLEFQRAAEAIDEGYRRGRDAIEEIRALMKAG